MAIKKDVFDSYTKQRESVELKNIIEKRSYTHNKVFEPLSVKTFLNKNDQKPENILARKENHSGTIREQSGYTNGNKTGINREQSGNNSGTIREQIGNNPGTQTGTLSGTIQEQFGNNSGTIREQFSNNSKLDIPFSVLTGLQKELIIFIFNLCKASGNKITNKISLEYISLELQRNSETVKTTIKRLIKKNCLIRLDFKSGRGGWSKYELPDKVFRELLHDNTMGNLETIREQFRNNSGTIQEQMGSNSGTQMGTQTGTTMSSSSGYNNIRLTTTGDEEFLKKWDLDIEPLAKIGFTKTHLEQIYSQKKLTPEITQDSIYAFAFDLDVNNRAEKINGQPLNFFMGILRKGKPYAPPANYESPSDRAMREYLESKEKLKKQRVEIEEKACRLAFEEWFFKLSLEEKKKYNITGMKFNPDSKVVESLAFSAFKDNIWQNMKQEIIKFKD